MTPSFQNPRGFEINAGDVIDRSENVLNQFRLFNSLQSKDLRDKIDASNTLLAAKTSLMDDNPVVETPDGEAVDLSKGQRALLLSAAMMAGTNPYMKPLLGTLTSLYESDITEKNALLRAKRIYEMQEMKDRDTAFKELQNKIFFDKGITKEGKKLLLQNLKEQYQAGEYPQLSTAVEKAEQPKKGKVKFPVIGADSEIAAMSGIGEVMIDLPVPQIFAQEKEWKQVGQPKVETMVGGKRAAVVLLQNTETGEYKEQIIPLEGAVSPKTIPTARSGGGRTKNKGAGTKRFDE